jgi:hypothetical protein
MKVVLIDVFQPLTCLLKGVMVFLFLCFFIHLLFIHSLVVIPSLFLTYLFPHLYIIKISGVCRDLFKLSRTRVSYVFINGD